MNKETKIPSGEEWHGYEDDLDASYAYNLFFGKSLKEYIPLVKDNPIERADELRFVPLPVFRYYVLGFADYLMSDESKSDYDATNSFLDLLIDRETKEPGSLKPVIDHLTPAIDRVANEQDYFDADIEIFGSFHELKQQLITLIECNNS